MHSWAPPVAREAKLVEHLADIAGKRRHPRSVGGMGPVVLQQMAVVLEHRPAAGCRGDDRVEPAFSGLPRECGCRAPGLGPAARFVTQVVRERAAAAGTARHHDLAAVAGEHADRRLVDFGREGALHAAHEQRHTLAAPALGGDHLRPLDPARPIGRAAREAQQRTDAPAEERRQQGRTARSHEREAREARARQYGAEQGAKRALGGRAFPGSLDVAARVIDQVHVIDARRAGRHAREAGEAAVDVTGHRGVRRRVLLQHVLDQVDAPARAVPLVAEQRIGGAGGEAKPAMDAGAEHLIGLGQRRVRQLALGELGLHPRYTPAYMRPGLSTPVGSKARLMRAVSAARPVAWG